MALARLDLHLSVGHSISWTLFVKVARTLQSEFGHESVLRLLSYEYAFEKGSEMFPEHFKP